MKIIVCLDEKNGMMFNKRRQSRDRAVTLDIIQMTAGERLWMNAYSAKLFEKSQTFYIEEDFLSECKDGDYCFVEDKKLAEFENQIEELIVYRWGRVYPADLKLDIDLEKGTYKKINENEMVGFSHPEMRKQIYKREA